MTDSSPGAVHAVHRVTVDVGGSAAPGVRFPARRVWGVFADAGELVEVGVVVCVGVASIVFAIVTGEASAFLGIGFVALVGLGVLASRKAESPAPRREAGVCLTADHLVVYLRRDRSVLRWDDVAEIRAARLRSGAVTVSKSDCVVIAGHDPANRGLVVPSRWIDDPLLLLNALQHYLARPEDRAELADARALRRLEVGLP